MGAVWYRARSELRRRWPSTLVLAVLAGVTAGIVLASVAGARRTSTAMDRFVEFNRPSHLFLFDEAGELDEEAVSTLPEVESTARAAYVLMAPPGPDGERSAAQTGTINPFLIIPLSGVSNRPRVVEGRLPDPDEALETIVDEELAEERRVGPGDTLRMYGYAEDQLEESPGIEPPRGPAMDFEVTGVFRAPDDVVPRASPDDVVYAGTQDMLLGPAWHDRFGDEVASYGPEGTLELGLRSGLAAVDEVEEQVRRIAGGDAVQIDANSESSMAREASDRSVRFGVISILAFAAVAAVTGVALLGQAMARTFAVEADDAPVLRALGIGSRSLALVAAIRAAAVAVPAGLVAVAVAVGLSPLFPISLARKAEIDPGVDVDVPVLVIGTIAAVVLLVVLGLVAAVGVTRRPEVPRLRRPSRVAAGLAGTGAPPSVVTGVRLALERGRGRAALTGLALAVLVVVGAATFGRSLDNLADSPDLQGWNWDVVVGDAENESIEDMGELLDRNPNVGGWSGVMRPFTATVDGVEVDLEAVGRDDGPTFAAVDGRAPSRAGEVALGEDTLEQVGAAVGDRVEVRFDTVTEQGSVLRGGGEVTVVGTVLFNDANEQKTRLGTGALVTLDGVDALGAEPFVSRFAVDYADGVDEDEAYRSLQADFYRTVLRPVTAVDVENLRRVGGLPAVLAGVVGALALAVLAHAIVITLRRRRRELAVLRTLGFLRLQLGAAVLVFAAATVVAAVAIGAPLGVAVGRWAWRLIADSLGTPAPPVVPVVLVALVGPFTLLVAAAVAAAPARSAADTEPALVLRSE